MNGNCKLYNVLLLIKLFDLPTKLLIKPFDHKTELLFSIDMNCNWILLI